MKEIWNRFKRPNLGAILGLVAASFLFSHNSIADGTDGESSSPHVWSANMMMATEYVFRGISQSNEDPAIQVGIDYMHEPSGFYVGTWASSVEFNTGSNDGTQIETNLYGGFTGAFSNGIEWDFGGLFYYYPEEADDDNGAEQDYVEVYGSIAYTIDSPMEPTMSFGFAYSPDYYGKDGDSIWLHSTFGVTTDLGIQPYVTVGFLDVEGDALTGATNGYEYVMYSIGGSYDIGMFTIDLNWTEAVNSADAVANQELSEAVILSISSSW